ncbi:MAG TPA: hypothetical protein VLV45_00625 [Gemmatimonadales bacterium]|nr:hypothetical protein [Gemmatimonadales bacterium]
MKRLSLMCAALLAAAPVLMAQNPADTSKAQHQRPSRAQFEARRQARMREYLGLTDDQFTKFKATQQRFQEQREPVMKQRRDLSEALRAQLRPGVAANVDSVRKLLDARDQNAAKLADLRRAEAREMSGYLSPVQRAQLALASDRFQGRFGHMRRGDGGRGGRGERGNNEWRHSKQGTDNG